MLIMKQERKVLLSIQALESEWYVINVNVPMNVGNKIDWILLLIGRIIIEHKYKLKKIFKKIPDRSLGFLQSIWFITI